MRIISVAGGIRSDASDKKIHLRNRIIVIFGQKMKSFNFSGVSYMHSWASTVVCFFSEEYMVFILKGDGNSVCDSCFYIFFDQRNRNSRFFLKLQNESVSYVSVSVLIFVFIPEHALSQILRCMSHFAITDGFEYAFSEFTGVGTENVRTGYDNFFAYSNQKFGVSSEIWIYEVKVFDDYASSFGELHIDG